MAAPLINFSGIASGIDSNALIKATSDARRAARVTPNETKIQNLQDTNEAFSDLKTKLTSLQTTLLGFATLSGGPLVKKAATSDESILTASASNSASNGNYSVTVSQLARNATLSLASSSGTYTSTTDVIAAGGGTIDFDIGTGGDLETVSIPITAGTTTLTGFVTSFNSATTKAVATLVNIGTSAAPDYRIVITGANEGTQTGQIVIDTSAGPAATFDTQGLSQAQDSQFQISGIGAGLGGDVITRSTNTISDVIPGVTFGLVSTSTTAVNVSVSDDATATTAKVQEFIDAYNEIVTYLSENNQITRQDNGDATGVTNVFSPLASTRIDDNALTALRAAITSSTYSSGNSVKIFADLGITTERDGTLKFDTTVFQTALSTETASVNQVLKNFGDTTATTSGTIDQYTRFGGIIALAEDSNDTQIQRLNDQIAKVEAEISKNEDSMRIRFANLESTIGRLQQQQTALTSALAGLSNS